MTILSKILATKKTREEMLNDPNVILIATDIISKYGAVIKKKSKIMFGIPESLLPFPEEDIKEAIDLLLRFLKNKGSWNKLKNKHPDVGDSILTNEYYRDRKSVV